MLKKAFQLHSTRPIRFYFIKRAFVIYECRYFTAAMNTRVQTQIIKNNPIMNENLLAQLATRGVVTFLRHCFKFITEHAILVRDNTCKYLLNSVFLIVHLKHS
jgi:DNA helicase TIP49 (TBP-interacting protein)